MNSSLLNTSLLTFGLRFCKQVNSPTSGTSVAPNAVLKRLQNMVSAAYAYKIPRVRSSVVHVPM